MLALWKHMMNETGVAFTDVGENLKTEEYLFT